PAASTAPSTWRNASRNTSRARPVSSSAIAPSPVKTALTADPAAAPAFGFHGRHSMKQRTIALGFTGASGLPYGMRLLECLLGVENVQVHLIYSQAAQIVAQQEMGIKLSSRPSEVDAALSARFNIPPNRLRVFGREEWFAPMASGSNPPDAYVVCPCTMGTLAKIAAG